MTSFPHVGPIPPWNIQLVLLAPSQKRISAVPLTQLDFLDGVFPDGAAPPLVFEVHLPGRSALPLLASHGALLSAHDQHLKSHVVRRSRR